MIFVGGGSITTCMSGPQPGDLLIRDGGRAGEFVLCDITSRHVVRGPFTSIQAAARAARELAPAAALWRENRDDRGRTLGAPTRLPALAAAFESDPYTPPATIP